MSAVGERMIAREGAGKATAGRPPETDNHREEAAPAS
jgi:hypothetical protein